MRASCSGQKVWQRVCRWPGSLVGWLTIWLMGAAAWRWPWVCFWWAPLLAASAALLASGRPSYERLVVTAATFWLYWLVMGLYATLLGLAQPRPPAQLAVWMALGLHLPLVFTPLELGKTLSLLSRPILGKRLSELTGLGLAVALKVSTGLLDDAARVKIALTLRAPGLGAVGRLKRLGLSLIRLSEQRAEEIARAMTGR